MKHLLFVVSVGAVACVCSCGGIVNPPQIRDITALVQLTCDFSTIHEFQHYWDGSLVANDLYQAITVNLTSLSYQASVSAGAHTIGVAIASQTASPNRCLIDGFVTSPTGGAGNGSQLFSFSDIRSFATGVVSTVVVTID